MGELVLTTFDWVPDTPRGFVRDVRIRWALEEAGLPYRVQGVPCRDRGAEHLAHQPFGQVQWLSDGAASMFESGAILLHLGERSEALLPREPSHRAETIQWMFAALNSVEMAVLPWSLFKFLGDGAQTPGPEHLNAFVAIRLRRMEPVLAARERLVGPFAIAALTMAAVLRLAVPCGAA